MQEVADLAGVSRTAVSAVINNKRGTIRLTEATRQKIEKVLRQTHYRANVVGKALAMGRSLIIGVVVPDVSIAFIPQSLQAIEDYAAGKDYGVLLMTTRQDEARKNHIIDFMLDRRVDGIIFADWTGMNLDIRNKLIRKNVPVSYLFQYPKHPLPRSGYACTDAEQVGYLGAGHLLELGHRHFACCGTSQWIQAGVKEAAAEVAGKKRIEYWRWEPPYSPLENIFNRWLRSRSRPTALFISGDEVALQIQSLAIRHGIRIPEDLAIVGIDDIPQASQAVIPMTTVRQPKYEQGWAATEILFDMIAGKPGRSVRLQPELVRRETT